MPKVASKPCPGCGFPINKDLWICPNCGRNRFRVIQRGIGFFLLGFFLLIFLVLIVLAVIAA
jgi:predicted nucleic acid-binding Zn ribbon protein